MKRPAAQAAAKSKPGPLKRPAARQAASAPEVPSELPRPKQRQRQRHICLQQKQELASAFGDCDKEKQELGDATDPDEPEEAQGRDRLLLGRLR